ncbi:AP-4-A phosphorylase [Amantichitinum ursilacus]|uniref:AP-4-A phosphorylase n=2 Tax=Amantichitinum ursilacus TaxID=857265 RepID=A0A0N1JRB0_9NEIS|nr:AP-4-A phosphorylase [Amantichitinum ursilacus]
MDVGCALCNDQGDLVVWREDLCRVIMVDEPGYPGFCRVILNRHAAEMTDLSVAERDRIMHVVFAVEGVLRETLNPDKINLASLGNMVPHVHWHVIPRWLTDRHFPNPIWAAPRHAESMVKVSPDMLESLKQRLSQLAP